MATWKKIGCAVDGTDASLEALRTAAGLASEMGAELVLVHVESGAAETLLAPPPSPSTRVERTEERLTEWTALARELRGAPVRLEMGWGPVASELAAFARREGCDLLVLGSKSKHAATFAIGSVAAHLIPHAPCSVLLVR